MIVIHNIAANQKWPQKELSDEVNLDDNSFCSNYFKKAASFFNFNKVS